MIGRSLITAIRTLTVLPIRGRDAEPMADALYVFPLVGLLIGGLVTLAAWVVGGFLGWPLGAAVLAVLLATWVTGGLHLDGLSDTVDANAGGQSRERRLEIMKDPHVGAFGVMAIVLALLIKTAAITQLTLAAQWAWIPAPFVLSRLVQVLLAVTLPYARAEGGKAEVFVKNARTAHFVVASLLALGLTLALMRFWGAPVFIVAFILGYGLARWMKRAYGGVTGDLLGMASECLEVSLLFLLAGGGIIVAQ